MSIIDTNMDFFSRKPSIITAHRTLCPPDWNWDSRRNGWNGFHLWFIAAGKGEASLRKERITLKTGSCFVLRMWETFIAEQDPADPLLVFGIYINFFDEKNVSAAANITGAPQRYREMPDVPFFRELMWRCVEVDNMGNKGTAGVWLSVILEEIRRTDALLDIKDSFRNDHALVNKLCAKIEANPEGQYKIEDLAAGAGYSADHFIRLFKRFKGSTPKNYIINSKITAAKKLLLFSSYSIKQIADNLGYPDAYMFSKQFKKTAGVSPKNYRTSVDR